MSTLKKFERQALRAAAGVCRGLETPDTREPELDDWDLLQEHLRRLRIAQEHDWTAATACIRNDIKYAANRLRRELKKLVELPPASVGISTKEVFKDILALRNDFDDVEINLQDKTIAVRTERITLEGVSLGAFQIVLDWSRLPQLRRGSVVSQDCYRVEACEPNYAANNDSTTHPHVQNNKLCEGDGVSSIKSTLVTGQLYEFFVIVQQVLKTYNSGSAYTALEDWNGEDSDRTHCCDCGDSLDREECACCDRCGGDLCDGCRSYCQQCEATLCQDHVLVCSVCDEKFCRDCSSVQLGARICKSCLEDQKKKEEEDAKSDATADRERECADDNFAANSVCVGETDPSA